MTETVLAFAFLGQILFFLMIRSVLNRNHQEGQIGRDFHAKLLRETRSHYESALNSLQEKFMSHSLAEYSSAKTQVNGSVKRAEPPEVEIHEEAMRMAEQTGLPISTVYERMRSVSPQPSALVGGEALE